MLSTDDRLQISETLARQAFMVDENALDQLGEVFTPDATYDMTSSGMGAFEGLEALRTAAGQLFASGHAPLSHFVTNIVISETGGVDGVGAIQGTDDHGSRRRARRRLRRHGRPA
ncbi:nuclear transport factor 2 family protein [Curtobacterium sp. MCPF17_052]|uniref:nuclear transport factor 2 family protein n=1 Tax=Curtobacterium sp. MCPF17_052 TaxID=2175655 RepID=UPI0024DF6DB3|nr:nuclear transport factor 2 family protein [Curtobacterium sp. MCPF17_052]WIB11688.1 nuclear transport factor 2 family protein [Curtobacterium sp. MCPF17_052]